MWLILHTGIYWYDLSQGQPKIQNLVILALVVFLGRWGISYINSTHLRLGEAQQIYWRKKVRQPVPRHLCLVTNHPLFSAWGEYLTVSSCKSQNQQKILHYNLFLDLTQPSHHILLLWEKTREYFPFFRVPAGVKPRVQCTYQHQRKGALNLQALLRKTPLKRRWLQ